MINDTFCNALYLFFGLSLFVLDPDPHSIAEIHPENLVFENFPYLFLKTTHTELYNFRLQAHHRLQAALAERQIDKTLCIALLRIGKNDFAGIDRKSVV